MTGVGRARGEVGRARGGAGLARGPLLLCAALLLGAPGLCSALTARMHAAFAPYRLGGRTTLSFGFSLAAAPALVPPPLTEIELRYPANLGIGLSGLGMETCSAGALEASGPSGCPADSVMGHGQVLTGIVLGDSRVDESAPITILRAPDQHGRLGLLFYAEGTSPVIANIVFSGVLLAAPSPFGGQVSIGVPLVPTLPGAPYISVVRLAATLGPRGVTYYERVGGLMLAYRPRGILLPPSCPRGGFHFQADFTFADGSHAFSRARVPCRGARRSSRGAAGGRPAS